MSFFQHKYAPLDLPGGEQLFDACTDDAESAILFGVSQGRGLDCVWSLVTTDDGSTWLLSGVHPETARGYLVTSIPWRFDSLGWLPVATLLGWES